MTPKRLGLSMMFVGLSLPVLTAAAQPDPLAEPEPEPSETPILAPPQSTGSSAGSSTEMVDAPPSVQTMPVRQDRTPNVGLMWAFQVGVPIFLDVDRSIEKAGGDLSFFAGADFGYFVVGGVMGVGWNPVDVDGVVVDGTTLSGRSPLHRIFLSLPEVRVQIPDLKVLLPYISGSFDMNWWNFRETAVACGFYYCTRFAVYRFTPGFTGRAGMGFDIKRGIHLDVGLRYSFTGKGDFFQRSRWWLTPYIGILVRRG